MTDPHNPTRLPRDREDALREQLRNQPSQHVAACALGGLLLGVGRVDEAVALLQAHVGDRACGDLLREYCIGERRNDEALLLIERREADAGASGLVDRAIASHLRGDLDGAMTCCKLAITADPRHAPAHNHLGRALFNARRSEPARASFIQAVRLAPEYAEAWHNLAHVLRDAREFEQAEHAYGHALRLRPSYRSALFNRGILRTALGKHEDALGDFNGVLAIDPSHGQACFNGALCLHLLGRLDMARPQYERAIALDPNNPLAHLQLGRLHGERSDAQSALRHFRMALDLNPRNAEAWAEIATVHEWMGLLDEAERAVTAGFNVAPDDPGLRLEQANLMRHRGDHALALAALRGIDPAMLQPHRRVRLQQMLEITQARPGQR